MAPRTRLLDLETHDVLFFYGAYHHSDDRASVATHALVFWPVFLVAALLLHQLVGAPLLHAAAVCAGLYGAYCFLLDRTVRRRSSQPPSSVRSRRRRPGPARSHHHH